MQNINRDLTSFVYLMVVLACTVVIVLGIQSAAYIINSILLATVITVAVMPIPTKMIERGTKPSTAFILTLLLVVVGLGLIVGLIFVSIGNMSSELAVDEASSTAAGSGEETQTQLDQLMSSIQNLVGPEQASQILGAVATFAGQAIGQSMLVLLIFIFMLSAAVTTSLADKFEQATSSRAVKRLSELTQGVQQYISITTVVNLAVGLGNAILLWILGVPFAVFWGVLAWLMGYIPTVGFWIAMIPPLVLAWVTQGVSTAAIVFLGYVLINGSVENLVKPRMMGQGLNMSPLIVFVSVFFWGWILGGIGAILAVPITLIILSVLDAFDATRWLAELAQPASPTRAEERDEAHRRLRGLWQETKELVKGEQR